MGSPPGHPGRAHVRRCAFVPPYLLARLALSEEVSAADCRETLALDEAFRAERAARASAPAVRAPALSGQWTVHTAAGNTRLPGTVARRAGEPATGDLAVDEAADGIAGSLALFAEVYARDSFDGRGAPVSLTVHYGRNYNNAFWDGTQLVFGDGDGRIFQRFTKAIDVLAHEFTHAVTERTAGLVYRDQPGALNESLSDVFAACLKQRLRGQRPEEADWLIGEGLFVPAINARALRDMAHPGTAYDDPRLGADPQPAHLRDFVETTDDNGGVHINSGIPNRAFHLAAVAIGAPSWEGAGRIWYDALTSRALTPHTDFAGFAEATVAVAGSHADVVGQAWADVGVMVDSASTPMPGSPAPDAAAPAPGDPLEVRRSGGFAGLRVSGVIDLAADDDRAMQAKAVLRDVDLAAVPQTVKNQADAFIYTFGYRGQEVAVCEPDLTAPLRRLADLALPPEQTFHA